MDGWQAYVLGLPIVFFVAIDHNYIYVQIAVWLLTENFKSGSFLL